MRNSDSWGHMWYQANQLIVPDHVVPSDFRIVTELPHLPRIEKVKQGLTLAAQGMQSGASATLSTLVAHNVSI